MCTLVPTWVSPVPGRNQLIYGSYLENIASNSELGVTTAIAGAGCCNTGVEQLVSFTDATDFPTANIKTYVMLRSKCRGYY